MVQKDLLHKKPAAGGLKRMPQVQKMRSYSALP